MFIIIYKEKNKNTYHISLIIDLIIISKSVIK